MDKLYYDLHGIKFDSFEELIVNCFLSEHFDTFKEYLYIQDYSKLDTSILELLVESDKYFDKQYMSKRMLRDYDDPTLFRVLICYEKHYNALEFIFNNYHLFYTNEEDILNIIFSELVSGYDTILWCNVYPLVADLLVLFCGKFDDIIEKINTCQGTLMGFVCYNPELIMPFISELVNEYDTNYKYDVKFPREFLIESIKQGVNIGNHIEGYNIKSVSDYSNRLAEKAIRFKNSDSYLFLHNQGYPIKMNQEIILMAGFDSRVLDTINNPFKNDDEINKSIYRGFRYYDNMLEFNTMMRVIEKFVIDPRNLLFQQYEYDGIPNMDSSLTHILFGYLTPYYQVDTDIIIQYEYSVDSFLQPIGSERFWKFNFMCMLRFHNNF